MGWSPLAVVGRLSLGLRLTALIAVPLLLIAIVTVLQLSQLWWDSAEIARFGEQLDRAAAVDRALDRLQEERDLTVLQMTERDGATSQALREQLTAAYGRTDEAIRQAGLSTAIPDWFVARDVMTDSDPAHRSDQQNNQNQPVPETLAELRLLVANAAEGSRMLNLYAALASEYHTSLIRWTYVDDAVVAVPASYVIAYQNIVAAAEWSARARAYGVVLLGQDRVDPGAWGQLTQLSDSERFSLEQAMQTTAQGQVGEVMRLMDEPPTLHAQELRSLVTRPDGPGRSEVRRMWLDATELRLDELHQVSDLFFTQLVETVDESALSANEELSEIATIVVVVAVAVAVAAWVVGRSISTPLRHLAVAARGASVGRLTEVEVPASNDAIGEIGEAYDELNRYMYEIANGAEEIAGGELTVEIEPRSSEDRLGTALQSMTRQLSLMVTESRQRSEELAETVGELQETVSHDALTGLVSRARFEELLDEQIARSRGGRTAFGVLFIDLDGFKGVNDTLGHDAGDELLCEVARRLGSAVRGDDVVARLGGDEFTVLLHDAREIELLQLTAHRVVEMVRVAYAIGGEEVRIGASVGLARYPDHGGSAEELLRAADRAMYEAKHSGGGDTRTAEPDTAA